VKAVKVQGNVYMIVGAGANIAAQVGEDGVLVVDAGAAGTSDKVLAAIRGIAPDKEIRWIVNTTFRPDHTGGNEPISKAGRTVNGNTADIVAHENVAARMIKAGVPDSSRPFKTYFEENRDFPFNNEAVLIYHPASANTDMESIVMFRKSDVVVAGDVYRTDSFPVVDPDSGGTTQGVIDALNYILAQTVPSKMLEEGGTYVIPGHGYISDEHDVVMYRDMMYIIRDRIKQMVDKNMTLEQVKAARPALDYEGRYGADTGPWTTAMFIEGIYKDLSAGRKAGATPRSAK
jgi:glyoxylase-like metal-dependent hydrolase (beta-lactamase superfamily II)